MLDVRCFCCSLLHTIDTRSESLRIRRILHSFILLSCPMAWFKRTDTELDPSGEKRVRTEGLWEKCDECRHVIWKKDLEANLYVCPKCDRHGRIDAESRLNLLLDDGQFEVFDTTLASTDPLKFTDTKAYSDRLRKTQSS